MILDWFQRKADARPREDASPSRAAVREQLASEPCASLLRDALERFPELEPRQAQVLVSDVVGQFFYETMDLPASESYHHASPWGLARHSLEVAAHSIRLARSRHFVGHAAPNPEEQEHRLPRLRYGCFLFALYHDVGKILQASVVGPSRDVHNPFVEPLGAFYDRPGRDRCRVEWRTSRALEDQLQLTPYLAGRILPRAAALYVGPRILAEIIERKSPAAAEVHGIVVEADSHSVQEDRRKAEVRAASADPVYAPGSFVAYLAKAFAEGTRQERFAANVPGGDVLLGRRYAFFSYPAGVLKLLGLVKECFGPSSVAARVLAEDETGARFFLAKLKADNGLFTDPLTGLWKLKATIRQGTESDVAEGVLVPLTHLGLSGEAAEPFAGSIAFSRTTDGSELGIDDFLAPPPELLPSRLPPEPAVPALPKVVPATLGPQDGIDAEGLARHLVEGVLAGWIPTNATQAQVYVGPKTTFVATPAVFIRMREQGLYQDFDPQDRKSAYLRTLARLDCVRKSPSNRIVYPIMLGPESERPLKVIKFDTLGLFKTEEVRERVGLWKDWERIIELPQGWKPGDAAPAQEEPND